MMRTLLGKLIVLQISILIVSGCSFSTVARPHRSLIEGDSELRENIKTIAVVGFLGEFKLAPSDVPTKVFAEGSHFWNVMENQYRAFTRALSYAEKFKLVPHEKVAKNAYYKKMIIASRLEDERFYNTTTPKGFRKISALDSFSYGKLCRSLGADALLMFECAYKWESEGRHKQGSIIAATCRVLDAHGNILYQQKHFNQPSGMRGGFRIYWRLDNDNSTRVKLVGEATRIFAEDFVAVFENRVNPSIEEPK